jgi:hypothetical protein
MKYSAHVELGLERDDRMSAPPQGLDALNPRALLWREFAVLR